VDALLLSILFAALAAWSWGKWPDLLVDFGHELYIPWQLAKGEILQRDIAYIYGPLSQYFNGFLFYLFGPSLQLLVASNIAILALIVALLSRLIERFSDRVTSLAATALFLAVFAFSQYQGIANYNFICPFTHESTHGLLLAITMIYLLERYLRRQKRIFVLGGGLAFGLAFLTRAEISFAALAAAAVILGVPLFIEPARRRAQLTAGALFLAAALIPPLIFFIYFIGKIPPVAAFQAVIGSWNTLAESSVADSPFYRATMGVDRPLLNAGRMLLSSAATLAAIGIIAGLSRLVPERTKWQFALGTGAGIALVAAAPFLPLSRVAYGLPVVCAVTAAACFLATIRPNRELIVKKSLLPLCAWSTFALALLGKVVFNVRFAHYGYYLASPAMIVLVVVLVRSIPRTLGRRGLFFRIVAISFLIALSVQQLRISDSFYRLKQYPVGEPPNTILHYNPETTGTGWVFRNALQWIGTNLPPDATLMALPQGVMLNYLSGHTNPTPYIQISMTEILLYRESKILEAIKEHPPDYIALVHVESGEFGVSYFGVDFRFGARIMAWVRENYDELVIFGQRPLQQPGFGILIMRQK